MAKFSAEEKLEAVQRYLNGKESARTVAAEIGISHRYLLTWVKQYEHNGVEAFVKRYTNYTKQFKLDVLNYMTEHGTSLYETAAIFKIAAASSIQNWKKQFETQGKDALQPKKKGAIGGILASISFDLTCGVTGAIMILFAFFLYSFMKEDVHIETQSMTNVQHYSSMTLLKDYKVYLFLSIGVVFYWITFNFWGTGAGPYLVELGYDISLYSILWTINGFVILFGQPLLMLLKNTIVKSINRQMVLSSIFYFIGYFFLLNFNENYSYFVIAMVVCTLGEMLLLPAIPLFFSEYTGNRAPFYMGLAGGFANVGRMVGPLVIGTLLDGWGISMTMVFIIICSVVSVAFFIIHLYAFKKKDYIETNLLADEKTN